KPTYNPEKLYSDNPVIRDCINRMYHGINGCTFAEVANSLKTQDPYMVLADFEDYRRAQKFSTECYNDQKKWAKMSLMNTACAGIFSADRSVRDYARDIWGL
ncbi:MAG: glycogen/starch/alpha-glucan phosphorylase, partial [Oscillospiraceae bacterium]|nr:glycogen/starch/alpha-glucan phosphorylase [Oscillospiraceae bacterium]